MLHYYVIATLFCPYLPATPHNVPDAGDEEILEIVIRENGDRHVAVVPKRDEPGRANLRADGREAVAARAPRHGFAARCHHIRQGL